MADGKCKENNKYCNKNMQNFHHKDQPAKLGERIKRRVRVEKVDGGRDITVWVRGKNLGTKHLPVTGDIYGGGGMRFGNVWGWRFKGNLHNIRLSKAPANAQGYKCIPGFSTPAKLIGGEVACLSSNKKDCKWNKGYCDGDKVAKSIWKNPDSTALLCGPGHTKFWKGPGYENANHWCNKMKKPLGFDEKNSPYYRDLAEKKLQEAKAVPPPPPPPVIPQGPCPAQSGQYSCGGKKTLCQNNSQIGGVSECKNAAEALGLNIASGSIIGAREDIPAGCSWGKGKIYWSTNKKDAGAPHANLSPVCLNQVAGGFVMKKDQKKCPVLSKEIHLKLHQAELAKKELEKIKKDCAKPVLTPQTWKAMLDKDDELVFARGKTVEGSYVPSGTIIMWSGKDPPAGWVLCNGSSGTPDLRNRFVLGAGDEEIGKKGGSAKILISQLPKHQHESLGDESKFSLGTAGSMNPSAGKWETQHIKTWQGQQKKYTKTQDAGMGKEFYPPYYRMAFIMKI